ncbi:PstS family phosphate ABC transporter substrate-binding protein [Sporosarcina sp. ANT_H38]|uniref:PstS family phosphate ABC transporter substrate-binding protein n=1 Tax=Sporosarcina sp. ANT_H38 TaxID=2597358 RepID=UPI0011F1E4B8|nr:PstS family phosphate ABC transporter substrate-binding protein [Sporosarcina sp. ANT_H38]KAA0948569.1 PstS family phosphate ABC transporter substrate-binding protein [Sporosarcina sp. ANT_H38]
MKNMKTLATLGLACSIFLAACGGTDGNTSAKTGESLSGSVAGDGSSTVAPIMEAIVEEYAQAEKDVKVSVGVSGTGGGFEKFIAGSTDFSNASRPIKDEEKAKLDEAGVDYTELKIANDGLTMVVNKENTWVDSLTVEDLTKMWTEDGTAKKWSDINPSWPAEEIVFYSPGTDSGTYDYFNEVVLEDADLVKSATLSEDDNVLVTGIKGDKNAVGFFGYAYYESNKDSLNAVLIDGVEPNAKTIESGEYTPFSRPLFVYVSNAAVKEKKEVRNFLEFVIDNSAEMSKAVGYVQLPEADYEEARKTLDSVK